MHPNGEFGEIDMGLAFSETRTLSRRDVDPTVEGAINKGGF